jgi:hypothetical protein
MGKTLPSLKAVQEEPGDGGGKMVYLFVSPKTDSFAQDSAALKPLPIGSSSVDKSHKSTVFNIFWHAPWR